MDVLTKYVDGHFRAMIRQVRKVVDLVGESQAPSHDRALGGLRGGMAARDIVVPKPWIAKAFVGVATEWITGDKGFVGASLTLERAVFVEVRHRLGDDGVRAFQPT